jgi:amphi-Trp domain-containing protein
MSSNSVELKRKVELWEVVNYLEDLAASFKAGKIVVEKGDKVVSLNPPKIVNLEIEAKHKKEKEKFSFEISWKAGASEEEDDDFKISSEMPATKEEQGEVKTEDS